MHRSLLLVIAAYLYGYGTSLLPAPGEVGTFWVSNIAAPYLLIPVLGGLLHRGAVAAVLTSCLAAAGAVAGFYRLHAVGFGRTPGEFDLPQDASAGEVRREAFQVWFDAMLMGNRPWLLVAVFVGAAAGVVGWRWRTRGDKVGVLLCAAVLVVEPLVYVLDVLPLLPSYNLSLGNLAAWSAEAAVGIVAIACLARYGNRRLEAPEPDPLAT